MNSSLDSNAVVVKLVEGLRWVYEINIFALNFQKREREPIHNCTLSYKVANLKWDQEIMSDTK